MKSIAMMATTVFVASNAFANADSQKAIEIYQNQPALDLPIVVTQTDWTDAAESGFSSFVNRLGKAISSKKCNTVKSCMRSTEANMYASQDPKSLILYSDCADFPYFLRAYYAYHNGLPFGFVNDIDKADRPYSSVANKDAELATKGLENSPYGNVVRSRGGSNVARAPGAEPNLISYLGRMFDTVSTATLRVGPLSPNHSLTDLYPVKINRSGIRPGTIVHSTGHAMVVWNIDPKGVVKVIDAHPDGSVQFKEITPSTLERSRPDQALGFFRFRSLHLLGASVASNGVLYGGKIVADSDADLFKAGKFSLEQWFGPGTNVPPGASVSPTDWTQGFKKINFFDYLAKQMRGSGIVVKADESVGDLILSLCNQIQMRVDDVNTTAASGLAGRAHPSALPADIFGEADPDWGTYSTPNRDFRLKGTVRDIVKLAVGQYRLAKSGDKSVQFAGSAQDFANALRSRVALVNKACKIQYKNSVGATVALSFNQVLGRLNRLSFDPYLCPEKLWGATGSELATCRDGDNDNAWYEAEQSMRNTTDKSANDLQNVRSNRPITLAMLQSGKYIDQAEDASINLGTSRIPIMNLDGVFGSADFIKMLSK